ncbi:hypothetical protein [Mycobacteroides abscessus]|uniref:hypothetical protein n=1 Tax=Mycobacteroides abscessus TaxID=36809 RepID=UPI00092A33D1|nr:hypothetical protein [Mycobacteroides abscessus]SIN36514.1 Uncharacterised protein [Mycobacteroides abscessus subsp. abscessus]
MTVPLDTSSASPEHDTPTIEAVSTLSELETLLTRPRTAGTPLLVRLEGPAAADLLGEAVAR